MSTRKTDDGFLTRWSRRKLEGKTPTKPEEEGGEGVPVSDGPAETEPEGADGEEEASPELTEADVEELGPGSDYTQFMKKGVSAQVQRLALRKLWLSNPVLANLDGLVDYGEDYRTAADAAGAIASLKQGKGLLKDEEESGAGDDAGTGEAAPEDVAEAAPAEKADEGEEAETGPVREPDDGDDTEEV